MDAIMEIRISVISDQASAALSKIEKALGGVGTSATKAGTETSAAMDKIDAALSASQQVAADCATAQKMYADAIAEGTAETLRGLEIRTLYREELEKQIAITQSLAEVQQEASSQTLGVSLSALTTITKEASAAELQLRQALADTNVSAEDTTAAYDLYIEKAIQMADIDKVMASAKADVALAFEDITVKTEKAIPVLSAYEALVQRVSVAEDVLSTAILESGARSEVAAQARRELVAASAQQIAVDGEVAAANAAAAKAVKLSGDSNVLLKKTIDENIDASLKWGKQVQWTGRQIEYTLGLPLLIVGAVATDFALKNEAAMNVLERVYKSASGTVGQTTSDLKLLADGFRDLSNEFGINQAQTIGIGTAWAKLGVNGGNLILMTKETMNVMALSGESSADATKTLVALSQQYGYSASQMHLALAQINEIANHSGVSFADLSSAIIRGGAAAVASGVPLRQYLALITAISPAAGSADLAATALKTIFSRLLAPTAASAKALGEIGINIQDASWKSADGATRISILSKAFESLTPAQQAAASSTIATRFQITRFAELMRDVANPMGAYNTSLKATANNSKTLGDYTSQITKYLASTPQAFKITLTQIENALAQIILPLLPTILSFVQRIVSLVQWFAQLSPRIQQLVVLGAGFVVVFGIMLRVVGAVTQMYASLGKMLMWVFELFGFGAAESAAATGQIVLDNGVMTVSFEEAGAAGEAAAAGISAAWLLVPIAIGLVVFAFRDQLSTAFEWLQGVVENDVPQWWDNMVNFIATAIDLLPAVFEAAFKDVISIVDAAAKDVYNLFSYLNPFAHHSPSLVENVKKGSGVVSDHYDKMSDGAQSFKDAHMSAVQAVPGMASAAGTYVSPAMTQAVPTTKAEVAALNAELKKQEAILRDLTAAQSKYSSELSAAKTALSNYAQTPIAGMREMQDRIDNNTQSQNVLNLAILRMEDTYGTIDQITARMSKLNGEYQLLQGQKLSLHNAGAGSDVLGGLDAQMATVAKAQTGLFGQADQIDDLRERLDKLAHTGQELALMNSITFDPLTQEITRLANTQKEMPFAWIEAHMKSERINVDNLTTAYQRAHAAVVAQQGVVNGLKDIQSAEPKIATAKKAKKAGFDALAAAGGTSFKPAGDTTGLKLPAGPDLSKLIAQMDADAKKMGKIDLFGGISAKLDKFLGTLPQRIGMLLGAIVLGIGAAVLAATLGLPVVLIGAIGAVLGAVIGHFVGGFDWSKIFGGLLDAAKKLGGWLMDGLRSIMPVLKWFGNLFAGLWHVITGVWDHITGGVHTAITFIGAQLAKLGPWLAPVGAELQKWGALFGQVFTTIKTLVMGALHLIQSQISMFASNVEIVWHALWAILRPVVNAVLPPIAAFIHGVFKGIEVVVGAVMKAIGLVIKTVWASVKPAIMPTLAFLAHFIGGIFTGIRDYVLGVMQFIRGTISLILDLLSGKWSKVWGDFKTIASGAWDALKGIILDPLHAIDHTIRTVVDNLKQFWSDVWGGFKTIVSNVFGDIKTTIYGIVNGIITAVNGIIHLLDKLHFHIHVPHIIGTSIGGDYDIGIPHIPDIPKLAQGGTATVGGTALVGEHGRELIDLPTGASVIPLTNGLRNGDTGKSNDGGVHFHGATLSFPNITDGNDAEEFVRNLKALATT